MLHDGGYMVGMHWLWWLFWIGILLAVFWPGRRRGQTRATPHEVLRRRLAAGDITTQEYEQRRALLDRDV